MNKICDIISVSVSSSIYWNMFQKLTEGPGFSISFLVLFQSALHRTMEWFVWKGILKVIYTKPHHGQGHHPLHHFAQIPLTLAYNFYRDGAPTTLWETHSDFLPTFFFMPNLNMPCFSLNLLPHVLSPQLFTDLGACRAVSLTCSHSSLLAAVAQRAQSAS